MSGEFNLEKYLLQGTENIVRELITAFVSNPAESIFMTGFAAASKKASAIRIAAAENGEHIPPFLIASITSRCNLNCAGCYSRANKACSDDKPINQLSAEEWGKIFNEASGLGISFILLAGGEPLVRPDVIRTAGSLKNVLFPVFTNGTMINSQYIDIFRKNRNLVPIISIEGGKDKTDSRRGEGVYKKVTDSMRLMRENKIIFGSSVTVTRENITEVTSADFLDSIENSGCRAVIYVEYVPVDNESGELALTDSDRDFLENRIEQIRKDCNNMLFLSFPGDEDTSDGCLAAGRGFFHINSHGGAEPCPFSPYSDINVRDTSVREALNSELFHTLQSEGLLKETHKGGCVLYEKRTQVQALFNA